MRKTRGFQQINSELMSIAKMVDNKNFDWKEFQDFAASIISNELKIPSEYLEPPEPSLDIRYTPKEVHKKIEESYEDIFLGNFKKELKPLLLSAAKEVNINIEIVVPSCGTRGYIGVRAHKPESMKTLHKFWRLFESFRDDVMIGAVVKKLKKFDTSKIRPGRALDL